MADQEEQQTEVAQTQTAQRETPIEQIRELKARIEALEKELTVERDKATDYMNRAMRTQAEMSNMRKRMQQDMSLALQEALKSMVYEQLGVLDSFDRAFATLPGEFAHFTWVEGMGLIQSQLFSILHRAGITPIESLGRKYDPLEHEAVAYEETANTPEDNVTAELQRGYKLQGQVIRPALVKIARAPQPQASSADESTTEETTTTRDE
ncbi:MAG: nucleotide exchange factor GrpE [Ktedonobacteraceae bacterium]